MKHFSTLLLALGLSATCAVGENVTVVMKDGTAHKYSAESLSEIYFREVEPQPDEVVFQNVDIKTFSSGNAELDLSTADGDVACEIDLYGTEDTIYLEPGVYSVNSSNEPFTIDPYWTEVTINDYPSSVVGGYVNVAIGAEGYELPEGVDPTHVYNILVNLELESGETVIGRYVGKLPSYSPWLEATLSSAYYLSLPQPKGQFYVKMNDLNWKYEMAMIFVADPSATTLPSGTYTLNDFASTGSLLPGSYVDGYGPNFNAHLSAGSKVIVTEAGGQYNMVLNLILDNGCEANFTFNGQITGTPQFESSTPEGVEFSGLDMTVYSNKNIGLVFSNPETSESIAFDLYEPNSSSYLQPGIYPIGGSGDFYIDPGIGYTYFLYSNNEKVAFKSGTLTISRDGSVYTFELDAILDDDDSTEVKMWHIGTLPTFGPEVNIDLVAAEYLSNPRPAGNFYIKFHDSNWKCEMALDMYANPGCTVLPSGVYDYSTSGEPGTFGSQSYVQLYNPASYNNLVDGSTVTVYTDEEGNYQFEMNLIFEDGREATITYEGEITGNPVFE